MAITRTNSLVTIGGFLAMLGTLPTLATNLHLALPLVWNDVTPWLNVAGLVGLGLMGWAAKGADVHSSPAQIAASGAAKQAEIQVQTADATAPIEKVEVVNQPAAVKGVILPKPVPKIVPKPKT